MTPAEALKVAYRHPDRAARALTRHQAAFRYGRVPVGGMWWFCWTQSGWVPMSSLQPFTIEDLFLSDDGVTIEWEVVPVPDIESKDVWRTPLMASESQIC